MQGCFLDNTPLFHWEKKRKWEGDGEQKALRTFGEIRNVPPHWLSDSISDWNYLWTGINRSFDYKPAWHKKETNMTKIQLMNLFVMLRRGKLQCDAWHFNKWWSTAAGAAGYALVICACFSGQNSFSCPMQTLRWNRWLINVFWGLELLSDLVFDLNVHLCILSSRFGQLNKSFTLCYSLTGKNWLESQYDKKWLQLCAMNLQSYCFWSGRFEDRDQVYNHSKSVTVSCTKATLVHQDGDGRQSQSAVSLWLNRVKLAIICNL